MNGLKGVKVTVLSSNEKWVIFFRLFKRETYIEVPKTLCGFRSNGISYEREGNDSFLRFGVFVLISST